MRSNLNIFGCPGVDRRTIQRSDDEWIDAQRGLAAARFVVIDGTLGLAEASGAPALARLPREALPATWQQWQSVFLGCVKDAPLFALAAPPEAVAHFERQGCFGELRALATLLPPADAALFAHARAVLHWHATHRFCSGCGQPLQCAAGGHARRCANTACALQEIFPRIDPAVIMLVTHEDRCLLGRQHAWPAGRYSCLAGFMEAGETLEETVRREVLEEAGVQLDEVRYHSSQPWPFPQSLMVGFMARAASPAITLHDDELEDARWFSRADMRRELAAGTLQLSARLSIAWRLLHDWYAEAGDPADLDVRVVT